MSEIKLIFAFKLSIAHNHSWTFEISTDPQIILKQNILFLTIV